MSQNGAVNRPKGETMFAGTIEIDTRRENGLRVGELVERFGRDAVITNGYPLLDGEGEFMGFAVEIEGDQSDASEAA